MKENILVTGAAGFIGFHMAKRLLDEGRQVVGMDNLNDYYDVGLKEARLEELRRYPNFRFYRLGLQYRAGVELLFEETKPAAVVHLAAQAGVRYSVEHPHVYAESNLTGFLHMLEGCRHYKVKHLVFASSSSVYGANLTLPFSVHDNVDHPLSFYAATKKANELMAHSYSHLYNIPCTGLRFFTVYGPWGRPDMALFSFTKAILEGKPIEVFNHGQMFRDFTYVEDVVEGMMRILALPPLGNPDWDGEHPDAASSRAPYRLYNIGNHKPEALLRMIEVLEEALGVEAQLNLKPMQPGDVPATYADVEDLSAATGFSPDTPIEEGIARFVAWYRDYYEV